VQSESRVIASGGAQRNIGYDFLCHSIRSVGSFKRTLGQAHAIALADPETGSISATHILAVIARLGMTMELRRKIRLARAAAGAPV
jgi:hypothetical protein